MGAIAYPGIRGLMSGYEIRGAARQVYSDMQMTRLGAIKEGKPWSLIFSPGNTAVTSYSIRDGSGTTVKTMAIAQSFPNMSFVENFSSGVMATFQPNGTASIGNVTVTMGGRSLRVIVNGSSGNIRIE